MNIEEKLKQLLYKQSGKTEVYLNNLYKGYSIGKVVIFTLEDLQELVDIVLEKNKIKKEGED